MNAKEWGKKQERHLEGYLFEGVLQTGVVPVSYHSYYGKLRAQETASYLGFYPDFFKQLFAGKIEGINVSEGNNIAYETIFNLPSRHTPYEEDELLDLFLEFTEKPLEKEKSKQKKI